jgi:hypothetical protein
MEKLAVNRNIVISSGEREILDPSHPFGMTI